TGSTWRAENGPQTERYGAAKAAILGGVAPSPGAGGEASRTLVEWRNHQSARAIIPKVGRCRPSWQHTSGSIWRPYCRFAARHCDGNLVDRKARHYNMA